MDWRRVSCLGSRILEVFMVGEYKYDMGRALEVVTPVGGLKYCE